MDGFAQSCDVGGFQVAGRWPKVARLVSLIGITLVAFAVQASIAAADEVTVKGTVLEGKITKLDGSSITFEPAYGKGSLTIKWEDIQALRSEDPFAVLHGDNEEVDGPLQAFTDGKLVVGPTAETAIAIDATTLFSGFPIGAEGPSFMNRMRSSFRYWSGNFDLGFNLQQATTNTRGFLLSFKTKRTKGPSRFSIGADYRYSTSEEKVRDPMTNVRTDKTTVIQDQFFGFVRQEYDVLTRMYVYGSGDATYDGVQRLSIRGIPKAGVGVIIWEEKLDETTRNFFQGEVGGGWVYEKYFGGHTNDYGTIAFGLLAGYYLPYDSHFDFKFDYLPAINDFSNYLMRGEVGLTIPVVDPISAKFSLINTYDSTPAPGTKANSLFLAFGISLAW